MTPDEPMELRKGKRKRKPKSFGPEFHLYLIEGSRDEVSTLYPYCFNVEDDPKTFDEAMKSQNVAFWKEAINDEMDSIMGNNTCVFVDQSPGCKPLDCKWIFKKKMKVDGTIENFKARLVIQDFRQRPGFLSNLEEYSDASWITNVEDHSSTSGWVFLLGGGAISWASKKQTCIIKSTIESEFVALIAAVKEAEWLRNLINEISLWPKLISPISIHCDNAATLAKAYSQMYNGKFRHLGVRHSMIRELIMNVAISVEFVRSQHNLADHLTKGLAKDLVHKSVIGMGLKSI
ncbi:UNVERIFIED_CONTAM: Retrovirus-related Pol polyprotein from transposon RE1 [Sesamum angustifolium]|uniref:Retrovirus-related Pol polyprotein from transposon RE1 n=1 Tax=Sesamum angustifolium TaxID=2727405 RepID=A0AAW2IRG4_9LAMI